MSARGREAAAALARELTFEPIAAVYSSPYPRAVQTVEPLAARRGLDIEIVADLRERLLSPDATPDWEAHVRRGWGDLAVLQGLAARHPDETIAAASHGNLIALALHAYDPSIGFDFWRAMPMPAVYPLDIQTNGSATETRRPAFGV